jgi:UDP-N-acetylmuramoylalanine--D-glutamate ligase
VTTCGGSSWKEHAEVVRCGTLDRAIVETASRVRDGDVVLLSPACASFDQFPDYEARGRAFKELVRARRSSGA